MVVRLESLQGERLLRLKRRSEVVALETDQPQGAGGCWRLLEVVALEFGTVIRARGCLTRNRSVDWAGVDATNGDRFLTELALQRQRLLLRWKPVSCGWVDELETGLLA